MTYIAGDHWKICDRCGFKKRASQTAKEWTGLIVCLDSCFEERHPQDFVRGRKDNQTVPDPRPEPATVIVGPLTTTTTAAASAGATTISVESSTRFAGGDHLRITLESGDTYAAIVQSVPGATSLLLTAGAPGAIASGALVVNRSAVTEADIG